VAAAGRSGRGVRLATSFIARELGFVRGGPGYGRRRSSAPRRGVRGVHP
jgi:hypothetical protein